MNRFKLLIASFVVLLLSACHIGDGFRVGEIQNFHKSGLFWPTYEGDLVMDGYKFKGNATSSLGTNVWSFSVKDPAVAKQIEDLTSQPGNRFKVTWVHEAPAWPWNGHTAYFVTKIERVSGQ